MAPSYKYQLHLDRIFQTPVIFPNGLMPGATTLLNDDPQLNAVVLDILTIYILSRTQSALRSDRSMPGITSVPTKSPACVTSTDLHP